MTGVTGVTGVTGGDVFQRRRSLRARDEAAAAGDARTVCGASGGRGRADSPQTPPSGLIIMHY